MKTTFLLFICIASQVCGTTQLPPAKITELMSVPGESRRGFMQKHSAVQVLGEVQQATFFEVRKGERVGDVVLAAGGFTRLSYHRQVVISRIDAKGQSTALTVSFASDRPSPEEVASSPEVLPGDFLFAPATVE